MKDFRSEREYAAFAHSAFLQDMSESQSMLYALAPYCHPACGVNCAECYRARSEAVGAEYEPNPLFDRNPVTSIAIACALVLGAATVGWVLAVPYISPLVVALMEKL